MNKRDPIYQNHGKLVVGVGSFAAILNFPTTELRLAAVETETQNNMLRAIVSGLANEMQ